MGLGEGAEAAAEDTGGGVRGVRLFKGPDLAMGVVEGVVDLIGVGYTADFREVEVEGGGLVRWKVVGR